MADFTVADVLAWARTKPADQTYRYTSSCGCALHQFLSETGRAIEPMVGPDDWYERGRSDVRFPISVGLNAAAQGLESDPDIQSFGAFVRRLEALVQETAAKPIWLEPQTYVDADCGEYVA